MTTRGMRWRSSSQVMGTSSRLQATATLRSPRPELFHPDVLICDWRLPGMDGVAVAHAIQRMDMIPVIFVTAHSVPDLRHRTKDLRVHAYLPKPIDVGRLRTALLALA